MLTLAKIKEFLKNLPNQPLRTRKIILWSIVIIISIGFFFLWLHGVKVKTGSFQKENFLKSINVPNLGEKLQEMPSTDLPENSGPNQEELKKLEEMIKEMEKEQPQEK